jgi:hypothetical protein
MNPIPFVPRYKASLAPEPEDKENHVPAPAPVGKRRREHSSDSILQEQNGKGKQRRTSAKAGKSLTEALVSEPTFNDDEEFDANLAAGLKVDDAISDEEYVPSPGDIEDDIGDEEDIPSPDDIEIEGDKEFDAHLAAELEADDDTGDEEDILSPGDIEDDVGDEEDILSPDDIEADGDEEFDANLAAELEADDDTGDEEDILSPGDIEDDVGDEEDILSPDDIEADGDEEFDANLAAELKADNDIGDKEYIPSPNGIEDDFFVKVETKPEIINPSMGANCDFVALLRDLISELVQWAKAHNVLKMDNKHRAMTLGYWSLLSRLSVDFAVALFLPGIPKEVQALFQKGNKEWSLEDFLSLPSAKDDGRQGIYANFATGDLRRQNEEYDIYIGSSCHLKKRIAYHLGVAERFSVTNLPDEDKRSFHYRQICRDGVQSNFQRLAAFDHPIEPGYLLLLEGIFMILFNTYQYPGYYSRYATMSSYRLTEKIINLLGIPSVPWRGMNAAWPLCQGFVNIGAKSASPCCNPACNQMTYPKALRPEGAPKSKRIHRDPGNPLGSYLCGRCHSYQSQHLGILPDKEVLAKLQEAREARAEAGPDAACHCCSMLESQAKTRTMTNSKGERIIHTRKWRIHALIPKKLLCDTCYDFVNKHKRLHTPEEVLRLSNLRAAKAAGGEIWCDDCGAIENPSEKNHVANSETGKVLCSACDYLARHGKPRNGGHLQCFTTQKQLRADREAGRPIVCSNPDCGAVEDLSVPEAKPFHVNRRSGRIMCSRCSNACYRREAAVRKAADHEAAARKAEKHCSDCGAVEDLSVPMARPFLVNKTSGRVMCIKCIARLLGDRLCAATAELSKIRSLDARAKALLSE